MEACINKIENINIQNSIFDEIIDCTYVILCCGSKPKRLESVLKNIKILRPTKIVKLVYNNGYKNCPLSISVNNDLVNIQKYVFKDSIKEGYNRILYLEDDFELENPIEKNTYQSINNFVKKHNPDIYGLGNFAIPNIQSIFSEHQKVIFNFLALTHALFYNRKAMEELIKYYDINENNIRIGIDTVISEIEDIKVYRYYKPLVYQKLPATENQIEGWKNQIGFLSNISIFVINLLNLDKMIEPGYTIIYFLPYILYLTIFIIFIIICIRNK